MLSPDVCHQKLLDIVHRDEVKVNWILSYNVEFLNSEKGPRDRYKLRHFTPFKKDAKRWRENRESLVSNLESRWSVLVEGRALGCSRSPWAPGCRSFAQPRPQGLLLDDFQNGGSSGEDDPPFWKSSRRRPWGRGWSFAISLQVVLKQHREHTILLSRERVNSVNKGTNCCHLFYLTRFYWESRWLLA